MQTTKPIFWSYEMTGPNTVSLDGAKANGSLQIALNDHFQEHYIDVIMTTMASQITSPTILYLTVYSDANQRKHQSSASLAFVWGIHRDRWIPRTKGQLRGKCFRLMTSSWERHTVGLFRIIQTAFISVPHMMKNCADLVKFPILNRTIFGYLSE